MLWKAVSDMNKMEMRLDYNNLMREIIETLITEDKSEEEIAETVKKQCFWHQHRT